MASISSIVTGGIGSWGSPSDIVTLGYGSAAAPSYSKNGNLYMEISPGLSIMLGNLKVPFWGTSGRPVGSSDVYFIGFNTDLAKLELWNGSTWITL